MGIAVARCVKEENIIIGSDINIIRIIDDTILPEYLSIAFNYPLKKELAKYAKGANILHLSNNDIKRIKVPLPSIKIQHEIVEKLEKERQMIEQQKVVIKNFEQNIKDRLDSLWSISDNVKDNQ